MNMHNNSARGYLFAFGWMMVEFGELCKATPLLSGTCIQYKGRIENIFIYYCILTTIDHQTDIFASIFDKFLKKYHLARSFK